MLKNELNYIEKRIIDKLLNIFKEYEIEYDVKDKIVILRKPIDIKKFILLKECLKNIDEKVADIRVITNRGSRTKLD